MEFILQFGKLLNDKRRWLFVVMVVAVTHILFQSLLLPYGNALMSLLPDGKVAMLGESSLLLSSSKSVMVRNPLALNVSELTDDSVSTGVKRIAHISDLKEDAGHQEGRETGNGLVSKGTDLVNTIELIIDRNVINSSLPEDDEDLNERVALDDFEDQENGSILELTGETRLAPSLELIVKPNQKSLTADDKSQIRKESRQENAGFESASVASSTVASLQNNTYLKNTISNGRSSVGSATLQGDLLTLKNNSAKISIVGKKKMKSEMPPKSVTTIDEMNRILVRHRRSSRSMRPRWSSKRDEEILGARSQIENAPDAMNDRELYAPVFRNVSMFKRSYELMERILKVYVYKDGKKPIFHQPILKGLYASEGWFMKLMEGNKRFVVKDPRKAHLFYMPFSSRMLEYSLYVRNSHNRTNLRQYLKDYANQIRAKYPYWNRTGGTDHFLVACHDWAPYETRHHMEYCIKALCNADVTTGFKIGRDVSLPETYVRSARNPLRDLGGKPPSQRCILAFYAGNMHGYVRPILLKYWKDKDPNMKIFGPMPPGVASKMNYIQHMKSSKFCICPKGYEVNSPRVVEAIFYECVPVIISDNFVPPFFNVLNWGTFSIILAEKDIPNLKEILLSIPEEKYLQMQLAVRKVQRHFLWHAKPEKYDLFHMTLHSIWYNRVYQIKRR